MSNLKLKPSINCCAFIQNKNFAKNKEHLIFEKNGIKIGLIGLVDQNYFDTLNYMPNIYLEDPMEVGKK